MTFEKNMAFALSCRLRPIQGFNPEDLLENNIEEFRRYLSNDSRLLWFQQYCLEQNIEGKINTSFLFSESSQYQGENGVAVDVVKEYWSATVFMNKEEVAVASAGETFVITDEKERNLISTKVRKAAIGAALSQAGFGVVGGFKMTENDKAQLEAEKNRAQMAAPLPFTMETDTAPAAPVAQDAFFGSNSQVSPAPNYAPAVQNNAPQVAQNSFFDNGVPVNPVSNNTPAPAPVSAPATTNMSPLEQAKRTVWCGGGRFENYTLGQILGDPNGGYKYLTWIATDYKPRNEAGHQIKAAAQLILSSVNTGK